MVTKVISGGQTGADRAGLDAAIERGIPHGGWCPWKRIAEDIAVPAKYQLIELPTFGYAQRTRRNIEESDGTVVFIQGPALSSGSRGTIRTAHALGKPLCVVDFSNTSLDEAVEMVQRWLSDCEAFGRPIDTLNVAGNRASVAPSIYAQVKAVMLRVLTTT